MAGLPAVEDPHAKTCEPTVSIDHSPDDVAESVGRAPEGDHLPSRFIGEKARYYARYGLTLPEADIFGTSNS